MGSIAIVGGTGPEGLGLGLRLALSGEQVRVGSRKLERAAAAAERANERLRAARCRTVISGHENRDAIESADLVVLAFPWEGVEGLLPRLAPQLRGRLVLEVVNPLVRENGIFRTRPVGAGSAAETIQALLPEARVVSGFKNQSAEELVDLTHPLAGDVLVCSDHADARARVMDLVTRLPHLRPVDAGRLVNARSLEAITALLLNLNRRHRAITSIQILGLDRSAPHRGA